MTRGGSTKRSKEGIPGSPTIADYQRVKGGAATEEQAPIDPREEEVIELERGAILVLSPIHDTEAWRYSVRWPDPRERDPMLAAGGSRSDVIYGDRDKAEAAGMAAYAKGPMKERQL